ncbi:rab11 family-interacting protein 4 isoform X3 [Melanaphis sacchari]|uniref:rab11 family-interacting protein 4 isoform X3 n=1 Tax=Melanaphis sacchari TaxID=742174 RepID=UPI000DC13344|nr:rab11 family-interacting protein 4 isoform X3 [Melanaphis sacchari]
MTMVRSQVLARMMAPKIQEDENIVNNNNKGDSPSFKLNIEDTAVHGGNTDSNSTNNSQFSSMSDEESYECYGEGDMDNSSPVNVITNVVENTNANALGLKRNTWLRTSLRRTANGHSSEILPNRKWGSMRHSSGKRISSNALASDLYRSSSFNSSGRSSICDTPDDVYSDTSIEEDVLDLNNKVQVLQKQMNSLTDNQHLTDERYARTKEENAALQARVHMLEEQLRDTELRCEERLASEERRHRELVARVDREKQLHIDNCAIRLQSIESANENLRLEAEKCKSALEAMRSEKISLEQRVSDLNVGAQSFKDEIRLLEAELRKLKQKERDNEEIIEGLTKDLEISRLEKEAMITKLHSPSPYVTELTAQLESLKHQNRSLKDSYDELQASSIAKGIERGRLLLTESPSLASELDGLTHDDMKTALKEQQEVNDQLRAYIDNILLNIVENHPELLEVKQNL